jgi:hypothetical protein
VDAIRGVQGERLGRRRISKFVLEQIRELSGGETISGDTAERFETVETRIHYARAGIRPVEDLGSWQGDRHRDGEASQP